MGDMFSKKSVSTTNQTLNQQVALQGRGQVGISGSNRIENVTVQTSDPEVLMSALDTVNGAIQAVGMSSNNNAIVSAMAIDASRENSSRALELANVSILSSGAALVKSLDFLTASQARGLETVDEAVKAAQTTALLATPQSPAAYSEIQKGQDNKTLIVGAILFAGVIGIVLWTSRNN